MAADETPEARANLTGLAQVPDGVSVTAGGTVTATFFVSNAGTAKSNAGEAGIYLSLASPSTSAEHLVAVRSVFPLVPTGMAVVRVDVTMPIVAHPTQCWLTCLADAGDTTLESNENDNRAVMAVHVTPSWEHDGDADGMSDAAEAVAGTDPLDSGSSLRVVQVDPIAAGIELVWPSVSNRWYRVLGEGGALSPWYAATPPFNRCTVPAGGRSAFLRLEVK